MRRAQAASLAAALAAGVVALGGCGSPPLSPVQLHQRASAICRRANRQLQSINPPQGAAGARPFLARGASGLSRELAELSSLNPSGDARHVYEAAVTAVGAELAAIRGTVHSLARGADAVSALRALAQRLTPLETQADDAWRALQISDCLTH